MSGIGKSIETQSRLVVAGEEGGAEGPAFTVDGCEKSYQDDEIVLKLT